MGAMRAILVEEILDSRDLVVKKMGDYIPKLKGIVGATILGDGSVTPVLDLPELLRVAPTRAFITPVISRSEVVSNIAAEQHRCALVVDDSLSARRSLAQFMEDAGFEVHTARDGLEAIGIIHAKRPDILLVDLEMPRMNGLELTSHVRANDVTNDLPVIMITSRSTEKHRQEADRVGVNVYLTKPFAEDELLEHVNAILECA
jgi:chemosensory pili system protein ChpA (sensor histidine kinase/response regulator)